MERIISTVIPSLVKEGIFGNVELKDISIDNNEEIGPQYGSILAFIKMMVKSDSGEVILPLFIKTLFPERKEDGRAQFMMESLMYTEVLPNLGLKQVCYPKMYYSSVSLENPHENIIVFENIREKQYCNSKCRTFLDFEHISIALKTIAEFHSLSFILKHKQPGKFLELTQKLKQYSFDPETYSVYNMPIYAAIERGVRGFEKQNGEEVLLDDLLKALDNPALIRYQLSQPEEPFDVICHGDFCNNNVMYKYNERGTPIECILFDYQLSIYGNVAVELAFFLYMHTDSECREKYWDSFMKIYWETLREAVPTNIELPTFQDFLEYFGTKAILGYIISSSFLPVVMNPDVQFWGLPMEKQILLMKNIGGDEGEKAIVNIFSHMYQKKYIHNFLKNIQTKML